MIYNKAYSKQHVLQSCKHDLFVDCLDLKKAKLSYFVGSDMLQQTNAKSVMPETHL